MAYDPDVPPSLITQDIGGTEGMRWFALYWVDPIATVLGEGYISNAFELGMRTGDTLRYMDTNRGEWDHYDLVMTVDPATGAGTPSFPELPPEAMPELEGLEPGDGEVVVYYDGRQYRVPISALRKEVWGDDFGMVADGDFDGNGTANDAAFLAAVNYVIANGTTLRIRDGIYTFRDPDGIPLVNPDIAFRLQGESKRGTVFVTDYDARHTPFIDGTNHDDPDGETRSKALIIDHISFRHSTGTTDGDGPVFISRHLGTEVFLNHVTFNNKGGTAYEFSGMFNCVINDATVYGGGYRKGYKDATGVRFSITSGDQTITAEDINGNPVAHFDAADVGETLRLEGNPIALFTIASFNSSSSVEVTETATTTITDKPGQWGAISGDVTDASAVVVQKRGAITSGDVGRYVYVSDAKSGDDGETAMGTTSGKRPMRAKILDVTGNNITLDKPASNTASGVTINFAPAVDIFASHVPFNETNDLIINALNIEQFRGVGLVIDEALNFKGQRLKVHGQNTGIADNLASDVNIMLIRAGGDFSGDIEGVCTSAKGQIHIYDEFLNFAIHDITGAQGENQWFVYWQNDEPNGRVSVSRVMRNNGISTRTTERIINRPNARPAPFIDGAFVSYRNIVQGKNHLPVMQGHGPYDSDMQTFHQAVINDARDGFEAIIDGEIPVFAGRRADQVVNNDIMARLLGSGIAPSGNQVEAAILDLFAASPSGAIVEGRALFRLRNSAGTLVDVLLISPSGMLPSADLGRNMGSGAFRWNQVFSGSLVLADGIAEPVVSTGNLVIYGDVADGDLKVKFADGTVKTIMLDT